MMASRTATTPERIRRLGQRRGGFVAFSKQANGVLIKPKRLVDPDDMLTPSEAKKVHQGMKQIKEGRFKLWRNVKREVGR